MPIALVRFPGPRQSSGPAGRRGGGGPRGNRSAAAAPPHERDAVAGIERANQHRRGRALRLGHDVHQAVNAVVQIDVRVAGRTVQRCVAPRRPRRRMTGGIGLTDVRLDLDDDAAGADAAPPMHENLADQIARDVERRPIVETTRGSMSSPIWPVPARLLSPRAYACDRPSARMARRYRPVCDASSCATCSGVPVATTRPPAFAAFRAEIDDVVGRLDHVEVVLDDEQRVARFEQLPERGEQLRDVVEVQTGRRLVEDVQQPLAAVRRQMRGDLDPLRLAARQRRRRLAEPQVARARSRRAPAAAAAPSASC